MLSSNKFPAFLTFHPLFNMANLVAKATVLFNSKLSINLRCCQLQISFRTQGPGSSAVRWVHALCQGGAGAANSCRFCPYTQDSASNRQVSQEGCEGRWQSPWQGDHRWGLAKYPGDHWGDHLVLYGRSHWTPSPCWLQSLKRCLFFSFFFTKLHLYMHIVSVPSINKAAAFTDHKFSSNAHLILPSRASKFQQRTCAQCKSELVWHWSWTHLAKCYVTCGRRRPSGEALDPLVLGGQLA